MEHRITSFTFRKIACPKPSCP